MGSKYQHISHQSLQVPSGILYNEIEGGIGSQLWQYPAAYTTLVGIDEKCVDILSQIEEITHSISADLASISIVTLEKNENDDNDICTMKGKLLKSYFTCIEELEERNMFDYPIGPQVQR